MRDVEGVVDSTVLAQNVVLLPPPPPPSAKTASDFLVVLGDALTGNASRMIVFLKVKSLAEADALLKEKHDTMFLLTFTPWNEDFKNLVKNIRSI